MFSRLLGVSILLIAVVQSTVTNSSKGQSADALTLSKQNSLYDDYDLNDQKLLGNNVEGSGGAASLDEYADDEEEEEHLAKVTASSTITTTSRTTIILTTTTATLSSTTSTLPSTTTTTTRRTTTSQWTKLTFNYEPLKKKNQSTTTLSPAFSDIDTSEFKDDNEEYADDLEDDAYYNEPTISDKVSPTTPSSTNRYPNLPTRQTVPVNHTTPIWMLFSFLTRPPIAAGILAGLTIGIFTSLILLICIIQRYHKREKSHSSYTTGLLYPNQYGYSKSPQEFYA